MRSLPEPYSIPLCPRKYHFLIQIPIIHIPPVEPTLHPYIHTDQYPFHFPLAPPKKHSLQKNLSPLIFLSPNACPILSISLSLLREYAYAILRISLPHQISLGLFGESFRTGHDRHRPLVEVRHRLLRLRVPLQSPALGCIVPSHDDARHGELGWMFQILLLQIVHGQIEIVSVVVEPDDGRYPDAGGSPGSGGADLIQDGDDAEAVCEVDHVGHGYGRAAVRQV
mmetsp:Transcript_38872/g.93502  ORF Transcript_38872/g.93502 Transcript_38872/m.93502 type:complete len:225 (-) Transcript_38872:1484-2158(-)